MNINNLIVFKLYIGIISIVFPCICMSLQVNYSKGEGKFDDIKKGQLNYNTLDHNN